MTRDDIEDIPADLADAVRQAAATVPPGQHSLGAVHRRRRMHQRRRTAAVAGVATVAVAAGAAGVPALLRSSGPGPEPFATTSTSASAAATAPAQRLILQAAYALADNVGVRAPGGGVAEVDAGGGLVTHPVRGMDATNQVVALPDGRLVMLGPRDLTPGVQREDGVNVTDLDMILAVGTTYSVNVRIMGESVELVGATGEGAYLLRARSRLVFHEFATGAERPLAAASAAITAAGQPDRLQQVTVEDGNLVVLSNTGDRYEVRVVDVTSGAERARRALLENAPGAWATNARVSPDGRTVVLAASRPTGDGIVTELLSFGVTPGTPSVRAQQIFTEDQRAKLPGVVCGLAFTDDHTLRVAWYLLPPGANRVYEISEVLKVSTMTV